MQLTEPAPAKINLALHVRGRLPDGRHRIETVFAFCTDGDLLTFERTDDGLSVVETRGPFGSDIGQDNLVTGAWWAMKNEAELEGGAHFVLEKNLPVAAGLGGGSADAAAALRLITRAFSLDPAIAEGIAPTLGSDVPACLLSMSARGDNAGDELRLVDLGVSGKPVLLVNPRVPISTAEIFARWDGVDRGPLEDWRDGRNDLDPIAVSLVPQLSYLLAWLIAQPGAEFVRMSGSGATCFALFENEEARDHAAEAVPREWWRLASFLR